jgi:uncharacterized BrkB/YihY/UPF0761 family membrane protein
MRHIWQLVKDSVSAWIEDYAPSMGAALAYYALFSIAPLLLIVSFVMSRPLRMDALPAPADRHSTKAIAMPRAGRSPR